MAIGPVQLIVLGFEILGIASRGPLHWAASGPTVMESGAGTQTTVQKMGIPASMWLAER